MDELRTIAGALDEIDANVRYIQREMPALALPDAIGIRAAAACDELLQATAETRSALAPLRDRVAYHTELDPAALLPTVSSRLREALESFHTAVAFIDERSGEDASLATVAILVNESGFNIVRAARAFEAALGASPEAIRSRDALRPTRDVLTFVCSVCSRVAGQFGWKQEDGVWSFFRRSFTSETGASTASAALLEALREARATGSPLTLYQLDFEWTPFYCPQCDACYCGDHYNPWDVFENDDGYFSHDSIRGVCPKGHERMLED